LLAFACVSHPTASDKGLGYRDPTFRIGKWGFKRPLLEHVIRAKIFSTQGECDGKATLPARSLCWGHGVYGITGRCCNRDLEWKTTIRPPVERRSGEMV